MNKMFAMTDGWETSAGAWIADMGERGDFSREFVLDAPMLERVRAASPATVLDLGSGEGRFCRMLASVGCDSVGIEPTDALRRHAAARHPGGAYVPGRAEALPFPDQSFDMVVSYMTLIDIPDLRAAYDEIRRVLKPGGRFLAANLSSYATALPKGWDRPWLADDAGERYAMACDDYLEERSFWIGWRGIRVRNHHRPFQAYMQPLIAAGMQLVHFEEPAPTGGPVDKADLYRRAPMFVVMEWQKA